MVYPLAAKLSAFIPGNSRAVDIAITPVQVDRNKAGTQIPSLSPGLVPLQTASVVLLMSPSIAGSAAPATVAGQVRSRLGES
jgi:hypothetical protein